MTRAWAIKSNDLVLVWSIRMTRKEAVEAFVKEWTQFDWEEWRKRGCKVVNVMVIEDGPGA